MEAIALTMHQEAPYPIVLQELIDALTYRKGWTFSLQDIDRGQGSRGLTFVATGMYPNAYEPENMIRVAHYFPVTPAAFNKQSWQRWLFDRILEIERHEAAEFFQIAGERPYAPHHGPGNDPYIIFDHGSEIERRIRFDGTMAPA